MKRHPTQLTLQSTSRLFDVDAGDEDIVNDFAALEQLRQSVHQNLRLRPLTGSIRPPSWFDFEDIPTPTSAASSTASVYYTPTDSPLNAFFKSPQLQSGPKPIHHSSLDAILSGSPRPILIDTRPINAFLLSHLRHSVNMAIPSLILKRCRKPGAGFQSLDALRQYITTDRGKKVWDETLADWDGNILIYDEDMEDKNSMAWVLVNALPSVVHHGRVDYLEGGLSSARADLSIQHIFMSGDSNTPLEQRQFQPKKPGGLFQLDTLTASRSKQLPQIEFDSPESSKSTKTPSRSWTIDGADVHSPSPVIALAPAPRPPPRRPSVPSLRKLDTQSLPKLSLKTQGSKSANVATGPTMPWHGKDSSPLNLLPPPPSTSHLHGSFLRVPKAPPPLSLGDSFNRTPTPSPPRTPMPRSPMTARPDDENEGPPSTEDPYPVFTVSTILPNFLFLGPELTNEEHVKELQNLGVKRILNIAAECEDELGLRSRFDSYVKIPMRDTVEEENIRKGVREVCDILDDARLHSSPTYIHCKAGKSRSVTAVIGYLIHANHWTLSRAYSFVLERRKGISPNIGFVSELMNFEEEELGGKSVGVINVDSTPQHEGGGFPGSNGGISNNAGNSVGARRPNHLRESLPPTFHPNSYSFGDEQQGPEIGDSGQETEIRDANGRYRHARRAPVDEATLQPMRRVSKAGLESGGFI